MTTADLLLAEQETVATEARRIAERLLALSIEMATCEDPERGDAIIAETRAASDRMQVLAGKAMRISGAPMIDGYRKRWLDLRTAVMTLGFHFYAGGDVIEPGHVVVYEGGWSIKTGQEMYRGDLAGAERWLAEYMHG